MVASNDSDQATVLESRLRLMSTHAPQRKVPQLMGNVSPLHSPIPFQPLARHWQISGITNWHYCAHFVLIVAAANTSVNQPENRLRKPPIAATAPRYIDMFQFAYDRRHR